MSIKNRLFLAFGLMLAFIVVLATITYFQGRIQRRYLKQSIISYTLLTEVRESLYYVEKAAKAYDFFLILGDISERSKFYEYSKLSEEKIVAYSRYLSEFNAKKEEISGFGAISETFNTLIVKWNNVLKIYDNGEKQKAIDLTEKNVTPIYNKLTEGLRRLITEKNNEYLQAEKNALQVERTNIVISTIIIMFAVLFATMLAIVIFRSISVPLTKLKFGAESIGKGNLSHRIDISGRDELAVLAVEFNKMAENLKKSETKILQLDRMASLGQLAGGIAHELNNPLTGVLGQSQFLLEKLSQGDPMRDAIEKISKAADRCRKITKGLLDFSRQKDFVFEKNDISKIIENVLSFSASDITANHISIIRKYDSSLPMVKISVPHIQQVFLNIITNAIHAMPEGGFLTITTTREQGFLVVSFKDTGKGITPENAKNIFTPFFTTKDPGKGTGLGLAISYGIIQRHGGNIEFASDGKNKGAVFKVKLPIGG